MFRLRRRPLTVRLGMFDGSCDHGQDMQQPRRWRVLMYYMDHTVLSFELSKTRVGVSPVLSELVV